MRILLLLNARFPTEKAYGIQTMTMAKGYVDAGHEVAIAYPRRSSEQPVSIGGVGMFPFGPRLALHAVWMFHPLRLIGALSAAKMLKKFKPDVVIANDPLQASILSKKWPVVWELHDVPDLRRIGRNRLVRNIASRVRAIVSTNELKIEALKTVVRNLPPYLVIPNAVTFDPIIYRQIVRGEARQKLGIPADEISVVYAGQLFDWKGVDTLIASAPFLSDRIVIHIVGGTGADLERCQDSASALKQGSARIVFHGQRPTEEIPFWLRAATLVVIPNSGRFEVSVRDTSPLKLFEALAAGAAVIASDVPSIKEVVSTSGAVTFFSADDASSLAKAISDIAGNEKTIDALRKKAETFPVYTGKARAFRIAEFLVSLPGLRR